MIKLEMGSKSRSKLLQMSTISLYKCLCQFPFNSHATNQPGVTYMRARAHARARSLADLHILPAVIFGGRVHERSNSNTNLSISPRHGHFEIHEIGSPIRKFIGKFVAFPFAGLSCFLFASVSTRLSSRAAERNSSVREEVDTSEQFPYTVSPSASCSYNPTPPPRARQSPVSAASSQPPLKF